MCGMFISPSRTLPQCLMRPRRSMDVSGTRSPCLHHVQPLMVCRLQDFASFDSMYSRTDSTAPGWTMIFQRQLLNLREQVFSWLKGNLCGCWLASPLILLVLSHLAGSTQGEYISVSTSVIHFWFECNSDVTSVLVAGVSCLKYRLLVFSVVS